MIFLVFLLELPLFGRIFMKKKLSFFLPSPSESPLIFFSNRRHKGRTITKVMRGGGGGGRRGIFSLHDFLFRPLLVQEFFLQVKPSARIFFFSDKYYFVCHLLIKKNYFTKELLYFVGFNNN